MKPLRLSALALVSHLLELLLDLLKDEIRLEPINRRAGGRSLDLVCSGAAEGISVSSGTHRGTWVLTSMLTVTFKRPKKRCCKSDLKKIFSKYIKQLPNSYPTTNTEFSLGEAKLSS